MSTRHPLLPLILVLFPGCVSEIQPEKLATAESGYREAKEKFSSEEYSEAETMLTTAIESGGLNADLLADAFLKRAVCRARRGAISEAHLDLDTASQAAPEGQLHAARAFVYLKQGETSKARTEEAKALNLDPTVTLYLD